MKKYQLAVVIGRFQPLHIGHEELIKKKGFYYEVYQKQLGLTNGEVE